VEQLILGVHNEFESLGRSDAQKALVILAGGPPEDSPFEKAWLLREQLNCTVLVITPQPSGASPQVVFSTDLSYDSVASAPALGKYIMPELSFAAAAEKVDHYLPLLQVCDHSGTPTTPPGWAEIMDKGLEPDGPATTTSPTSTWEDLMIRNQFKGPVLPTTTTSPATTTPPGWAEIMDKGLGPATTTSPTSTWEDLMVQFQGPGPLPSDLPSPGPATQAPTAGPATQKKVSCEGLKEGMDLRCNGDDIDIGTVGQGNFHLCERACERDPRAGGGVTGCCRINNQNGKCSFLPDTVAKNGKAVLKPANNPTRYAVLCAIPEDSEEEIIQSTLGPATLAPTVAPSTSGPTVATVRETPAPTTTPNDPHECGECLGGIANFTIRSGGDLRAASSSDRCSVHRSFDGQPLNIWGVSVEHLFEDNVAMNPASFKFYLESCRSKGDMAGSSSCEFKEVMQGNIADIRFPVGISRVKAQAEDLSGNSHSCMRTVIVYDWRPPEFAPELSEDEDSGKLSIDMPVDACSFRASETFSRYEKLNSELTLPDAALDNCDEKVTLLKSIYSADGELLYTSGDSQSDPDLGPGEYKMVYTAVDDYSKTINYTTLASDGSVSDYSPPEGTDALYHRSFHNVTLHLKDQTAPTEITDCPRDIEVSIGADETPSNVKITRNGKAKVTWTPPALKADNCLGSMGAPDAVEISEPPKRPGMTFPVGVHRVRYRIRDAAQNSYPLGCEFNIRVTPHPILLSCPPDVLATTLPRRNFTIVKWDDPVVRQDGKTLTAPQVNISYPQGVASGMPFPFGSTRITVRANHEDHEDLVDECSFTVTVRDLESPEPCAHEDRVCEQADDGNAGPFGICDGPELTIALNEEWPKVFDYATLGVKNRGPRGCCQSRRGIAHVCTAIPDSASKFCKPAGPR
jgi:hypothetical protein